MPRTPLCSARFLVAAGACAALAASAHAVDRHVPSQYPTIQAAFDACAPSGDRVILADGTYSGAANKNIDFASRRIMVMSASGNPASCIIDCQDAGRAFYIQGAQDLSSGVSGITIRDGNAFGYGGQNQGGGILIGWSLGGSSCLITNCVIESCRADKGGGIFVDRVGTLPVISNTVVRGNVAGNGIGNGGGIMSDHGAGPTIVNCVIVGNAGGSGAAFHQETGSAIVRNCVITGNTTGVTFGLSVVRVGGGSSDISNCIIWGNSGTLLSQSGGSIRYCDLEGFPTPPNADGNFGADPLFVNVAAGDYRLQAGSPCINRGSLVGVTVPPFPGEIGVPLDLGGSWRICGAGVDVGAHEFGECAPPPNNHCASAIPVNVGTHSGNAAYASTDGATSCDATSHDVWYVYTPTAYTHLHLNTCGSSFDTVLTLYSGACGGLTEIACNDQAGVGFCGAGLTNDSRLDAEAFPGTTYFIRIASWRTSSAGNYVLNVTAESAPANDSCPTPVPAFPSSQHAGNTALAQTDGAAACVPQGSGHDVWYSYTSTRNHTITFDTCGSAIDTVLSVYTGACGSLAQVACNDDGSLPGNPCTATPLASAVALSATAGTSYLIRVASFGTTVGGAFTLNIGPITNTTPIDLLVPSQYATIQSAVDAAFPGDRVVLANGTYTGPGNRAVDFGAKNITLRSASGNPSLCIIDAEFAARCLYIHGGQTSTCRVENLTLTRGISNSGSGAAIVGSSPTFDRCVFENNSANQFNGLGGGIFLSLNANAAFHDCIFRLNTTALFDGRWGGAGYITDSSPTFTNCVFQQNTAIQGAGLYLSNSNAVLTGCTFQMNNVGGFAPSAGGGLAIAGGAPIIRNCTLQGNTGVNGGGIWSNAGSPVIVNALVTGNTVFGGGGAGISTTGGAPVIRNCTITGNSASHGGGLLLGSGIVTNCIIRGNSANVDPNIEQLGGSVTFSNLELGFIPPNPNADGNFNANPLFVDAALGDYRLAFNSPCSNRGSNIGITAPPFPTNSGGTMIDRAGAARIQGGLIDVGAYEGTFPSNNRCETAAAIVARSTPFDTSLAAANGSTSCGSSNASPALWFSYTAACTDVASISLCGSSYDTVASLYTGSCGTLSQVACNDDAEVGPCSPSLQSYIVFNAVAGTTYKIRVSGFNGARGSGTLRILCGCVADVDDGSATGTPDGGVTIDDLLYYLNIFENGLLAADVDDGSGTGLADGGVTIDDLLYFLARFESGC